MIKNIIIVCMTLIVSTAANSQKNLNSKNKMKNHDVSMFPKATEGFERFVIELEPQQNEDDFKLELYAGKLTEVDCNRHTLSGDFEKQTLQGWGYGFYNFNSKGMIMSTMMACPDKTRKTAFVSSTSELVRYNSKLPIVVYIPKGMDVHYKIWERSNEEKKGIKN